MQTFEEIMAEMAMSRRRSFAKRASALSVELTESIAKKQSKMDQNGAYDVMTPGYGNVNGNITGPKENPPTTINFRRGPQSKGHELTLNNVPLYGPRYPDAYKEWFAKTVYWKDKFGNLRSKVVSTNDPSKADQVYKYFDLTTGKGLEEYGKIPRRIDAAWDYDKDGNLKMVKDRDGNLVPARGPHKFVPWMSGRRKDALRNQDIAHNREVYLDSVSHGDPKLREQAKKELRDQAVDEAYWRSLEDYDRRRRMEKADMLKHLWRATLISNRGKWRDDLPEGEVQDRNAISNDDYSNYVIDGTPDWTWDFEKNILRNIEYNQNAGETRTISDEDLDQLLELHPEWKDIAKTDYARDLMKDLLAEMHPEEFQTFVYGNDAVTGDAGVPNPLGVTKPAIPYGSLALTRSNEAQRSLSDRMNRRFGFTRRDAELNDLTQAAARRMEGVTDEDIAAGKKRRADIAAFWSDPEQDSYIQNILRIRRMTESNPEIKAFLEANPQFNDDMDLVKKIAALASNYQHNYNSKQMVDYQAHMQEGNPNEMARRAKLKEKVEKIRSILESYGVPMDENGDIDPEYLEELKVIQAKADRARGLAQNATDRSYEDRFADEIRKVLRGENFSKGFSKIADENDIKLLLQIKQAVKNGDPLPASYTIGTRPTPKLKGVDQSGTVPNEHVVHTARSRGEMSEDRVGQTRAEYGRNSGKAISGQSMQTPLMDPENKYNPMTKEFFEQNIDEDVKRRLLELSYEANDLDERLDARKGNGEDITGSEDYERLNGIRKEAEDLLTSEEDRIIPLWREQPEALKYYAPHDTGLNLFDRRRLYDDLGGRNGKMDHGTAEDIYLDLIDQLGGSQKLKEMRASDGEYNVFEDEALAKEIKDVLKRTWDVQRQRLISDRGLKFDNNKEYKDYLTKQAESGDRVATKNLNFLMNITHAAAIIGKRAKTAQASKEFDEKAKADARAATKEKNEAAEAKYKQEVADKAQKKQALLDQIHSEMYNDEIFRRYASQDVPNPPREGTGIQTKAGVPEQTFLTNHDQARIANEKAMEEAKAKVAPEALADNAEAMPIPAEQKPSNIPVEEEQNRTGELASKLGASDALYDPPEGRVPKDKKAVDAGAETTADTATDTSVTPEPEVPQPPVDDIDDKPLTKSKESNGMPFEMMSLKDMMSSIYNNSGKEGHPYGKPIEGQVFAYGAAPVTMGTGKSAPMGEPKVAVENGDGCTVKEVEVKGLGD
jgi:hypothetical protein